LYADTANNSGVRSQALKFFAVHYGLLLAYASILTQGKRAPASRKPLCTFAEKLLMCFRTSPLNYLQIHRYRYLLAGGLA